MEWYIEAAIVFGLLLLVLASGMPVTFALGIVGLVGTFILYGWEATKILALIVFHWGTIFSVICLPLFVLMAEFLIFSGCADALFNCVQKWLARIPGSLAITSVGSCGVFAAIVGGSTVNAAAIGRVAIPEMLKRGYDPRLATGCVAAGGTLGILIPPSGIMILYAILTEQSIGQLFMGGIIPGIILIVLFSFYIILRVHRDPKLAPSPGGTASWGEKVRSLKGIWPTLLIIFLVLGTIYLGVCTPSESAALGSLGAIVVALAYHKTSWPVVRDALLGTMRLSGFICVLVMGAMMFGALIARMGITDQMISWVDSLNLSPLTIIVTINLLYIFLGCFIDPAAMIALTIPIVFPLVMKAGFDPIWFGVMVTINMEMGNITPPVGLNLYVLRMISPAEVKFSDIIMGTLPYVILMAFGIALVIAFPDLILFIPKHMRVD